MNKETYNQLQLKSEEYAATGAVLTDKAFREGAYWLDEQYGWKDIEDVEPPQTTPVLVRYKKDLEVIDTFVGSFISNIIKAPNFTHTRQTVLDNGTTIEWTNIPD